METCRLKNIAILILLLLNAVLLLLLGHQHLQARHSAREADGQLRALYAAGQLALDDSVDLARRYVRCPMLRPGCSSAPQR